MRAAAEQARSWNSQGGSSESCLVSRGSSDPRDYHLIAVDEGGHAFLRPIFDAFAPSTLQVWTDRGVTPSSFDRVGCDGLVTVLGRWDGRDVAVVWSDFRVNGAAYGRANSKRFVAFLRFLRRREPGTPLVYVVNSAGVSIMEDRLAFSSAFGIWPELLDYSENQLVLTCASSRCLGLAPLLFGLGHYRVAIAEKTQVNLTGPDVIRMFFGKSLDFDQHASAERCLNQHDLIHEVVPSRADALQLFRDLIRGSRGAVRDRAVPELGPRTGRLLDRVLDDPPRELVPGWCPRVRLFLGTRNGRPVGVFANPRERSNNLITVRTLDKYAAGLDLFRALRVPIVSLLDSPGLDPRFEESDAGNIRRILSVGERIIRYPYGSLGVVVGRCYGGATTLAFPKVFGGKRSLVLKGASVGLMDDRIMSELLSLVPRLMARWKEQVARRGPEFQDLVDEGTVDAVIEPAELPAEIDRLLASRDDESLALSLDRARRAGSARWKLRSGPLPDVG